MELKFSEITQQVIGAMIWDLVFSKGYITMRCILNYSAGG